MTRFRFPMLYPRRWRLRDMRRARVTRWLLLAGVLAMLGLQSALAAYACTLPAGTMESTMAMGVSATDTTSASACPQMKHTSADRMMCAKHCASDDASAPTAVHPLSVPANTLVAPLPVALAVLATSSPMTVRQRQSDRLRSPPPSPTLLFCSLLI